MAARAQSTPGIVAVGVTGKPFIFAAGADLGVAAVIRARDEALAVGRLGHEVFRRFGELSVPSFAFVNGAALGGGLELALHCSYRTISSGVTAVAFPECFLGLLPGWGGTYLLPRLIGPAKALKLIIENPLSQNRMVAGPEAFSLGIADALFEPADFLASSLRWAARVLKGSVPVPRAIPEEDWAAAAAGARFFADGKLHGAAPAPYRAIELVAAARDRTRDEGFAAEDEGAGRPAAQRRAAGQPVRVRPDPEAGAARGGSAGRVAGPAGDQGRRGGRGPDGRADRAAVRAATRGAGGTD